MKQILLSLLLLCTLSAFAQDKKIVPPTQKKQQSTTVVDTKHKAEQEAARKRAEAKRREQARQEQLRQEQEEREQQARLEAQRREQEERERIASLNAPVIGASTYAPNVMTFTAKGVSFQMVEVRGGTFHMGATTEQGRDADGYEKPVHEVAVNSFYIGKYEVTQDLWQAVMGNNPSNFKGSRKPVDQLSWNDCQTFISKLNSITGQRFRLPTEAEWEFASRGGTMSRGYKYSGSNTLSDVAWYNGAHGSPTHDVGRKYPNELGIYDMSGNVLEWCLDWFGTYSSDSQTNPEGVGNGSRRVSRGGSIFASAKFCRVSQRNYGTPDIGEIYRGLRLVLSE